jgi:hypothetical protein
LHSIRQTGGSIGRLYSKKRLPHREFIKMQIRTNRVIYIHQGNYEAIAIAWKFTHLPQNSPRNHLAILWGRFPSIELEN